LIELIGLIEDNQPNQQAVSFTAINPINLTISVQVSSGVFPSV
jgi:hypothetical protein